VDTRRSRGDTPSSRAMLIVRGSPRGEERVRGCKPAALPDSRSSWWDPRAHPLWPNSNRPPRRVPKPRIPSPAGASARYAGRTTSIAWQVTACGPRGAPSVSRVATKEAVCLTVAALALSGCAGPSGYRTLFTQCPCYVVEPAPVTAEPAPRLVAPVREPKRRPPEQQPRRKRCGARSPPIHPPTRQYRASTLPNGSANAGSRSAWTRSSTRRSRASVAGAEPRCVSAATVAPATLCTKLRKPITVRETLSRPGRATASPGRTSPCGRPSG
jgi:hypothetical protein